MDSWTLYDNMGGILLMLGAVYCTRTILRAWLLSLVGHTAGEIGGTLIEIGIGAYLFMQSLWNPAYLLVIIGWFNCAFQQLARA